MARSPRRAASSPSPAPSRQRSHRLTRLRSHGCGSAVKSSCWLPSNPRRRICQTSRSNSASQPSPSARSQTLRRASISSARRVESRGAGRPIPVRHSCSVRSSNDTTPVAARARTTAMTTAGKVLVARWSWRHCNAYWISRRSCGPTTPNRMISSAVTATGSKRRTKTSIAGRPLTFQVLAWAWQSGNARLRPQIAVLHGADHARWRRLDRRRVGQPPVQVGPSGAVPPLPV